MQPKLNATQTVFPLFLLSLQLTLTTRGLPKLDDGSAYGYQCTFGDLPLAEATVVTMNDTSLVQCLTPASDVLPPIGPGKQIIFLLVQVFTHTLMCVNTVYSVLFQVL